MTHPNVIVISNLYVKSERPMFLYKKGIDRTQIMNCFCFSYIEIVPMTLGQNHETPLGQEQSL